MSMNGKKKFLNALDKRRLGCCNRCLVNCWCQHRVEEIHHKLIGGAYPEVMPAPNPTLIMWQNLGVGRISQCCRALLVYFLSALIISIGFAVIIYFNYLSEQRTINAWSPTMC